MTDLLRFDFSKLANPSVPSISKGQVTVLICRQGRAQKTISPTSTKGYVCGTYFDVEVYPANNLHDLAQVLQYVRQNPRAFIVRGIPIGKERSNVVRRSFGPTATLRSPVDGGYWLCFDIDSEEVDISDGPATVIPRWVAGKAPQLQEVSFIWQASASWGIKSGLRAHLWYWLEEPRSESQILEWSESLPFKIDKTLFNIVQPHYVNDPVFANGAVDPLAGQSRIGMIEGREPALFVPSGDIETEIQHWEERIYQLAETGEPRHPVINKAGYFLGGWAGSGLLDTSEIEDRLVSACERSGAFESDRLDEARKEINRAITDGRKSPREVCGWKVGCMVNDKGAILPIPANILHILRNHPSIRGVFAFDVRKGEPIVVKPSPWDRDSELPRPLTDGDDLEASAWLNKIGMRSNIARVSDAITVVAHENPIEEVKSWLENLPQWDKVGRLDEFCEQAFGVQSSQFHREIGRRFLISMVARTLSPGCKADHMLVLIGDQGKLKSTALEILASGPGAYYSEELGDITSPRDYIPVLQGPWLIEEAEMSNFSRKEVESVKRFLSMKEDRARLSYGRRVTVCLRRCVFAGTSNNTDFLQDLTGGRRFWPVDVGRVNLQWIRENREQLFAEALARYRSGERWHLEGDVIEEAKETQEAHTLTDPIENKIRRYLNSPIPVTNVDFSANPDAGQTRAEVTIDELISQCLNKDWSMFTARRVGQALRRLGWEKKRKRDSTTGDLIWIFVKKIVDTDHSS